MQNKMALTGKGNIKMGAPATRILVCFMCMVGIYVAEYNYKNCIKQNPILNHKNINNLLA